MEFTDQQIAHVYQSLDKWYRTTHKYELSFADLIHSNLIKRLLRGGEVLDEEEYKKRKAEKTL